MRMVRRTLPAVLGLSLAAGLALATPAWAGPGPSGTTATQVADGLSAVAAAASSDAWAVGIWHDAGRHEQTLIEHWNGTGWHLVTSPNPAGASADNELDAVAVTSSTDAWAVGQFWNGANWQPLTEHWTGASWRLVTCPDPGGHAVRDDLAGVAATSSSSAWAVGEYSAGSTERSLILRWNGKTWTQVPSPNPGGSHGSVLTAVTAVSASSIWAVGEYWTATLEKTLVLHWNGRSWSQVGSPNGGTASSLAGVAFGTASSASAVGSYYNAAAQQTLTEHWNGSSWRLVASPDPGGSAVTNELVAVAATGSQAWAVGNFAIGSTYLPLSMRWNGTSWKVTTVPLPAGTTRAAFWGAGPTPSGHAWAVGDYFASGSGRTLIEWWNGTAWRRFPSPNR